MTTARIWGGVPAVNKNFLHRVRFAVGDPAALAEINSKATFICREIELERARQSARADHCAGYSDFTPVGGLSGDRETATAQSLAELLRREGVTTAVADRSLPLIFAHFIEQGGIELVCDVEAGVMERRAKDDHEVARLREAQGVTEQTMQMACSLVARADARADGVLIHDGEPLTSERVTAEIDVFLLRRGYSTPHGSIVAGGRIGADCHHAGAGELRTGEPVIVDIFPLNTATGYHGDCTRTVVHGDVPDTVATMHAAVVEAKASGTVATRPGATGEDVHKATAAVIERHGFHMGMPPDDAPDSYCTMSHGTGHGIGLDVHEPPLLDIGGPALVAGDALTIEPGLYCRAVGGLRVEDMVIVTNDGCTNLNTLPEGLDWK